MLRHLLKKLVIWEKNHNIKRFEGTNAIVHSLPTGLLQRCTGCNSNVLLKRLQSV